VIVPGDGANVTGSSALIRNSIAWPRGFQPAPSPSSGVGPKESGSPAATRICSFTRSKLVTISVTGCSTWMRVFISMK
jgi:hypothetical protein